MADASARARLQRALERGSLVQAELAARELQQVNLADSLRLVLLMLAERDRRFEPAAVRWWGRVLTDKPTLGLELAGEGIEALSELDGVAANVARSRLALTLRHAGLDSAAEQLERLERY